MRGHMRGYARSFEAILRYPSTGVRHVVTTAAVLVAVPVGLIIPGLPGRALLTHTQRIPDRLTPERTTVEYDRVDLIYY